MSASWCSLTLLDNEGLPAIWDTAVFLIRYASPVESWMSRSSQSCCLFCCQIHSVAAPYEICMCFQICTCIFWGATVRRHFLIPFGTFSSIVLYKIIEKSLILKFVTICCKPDADTHTPSDIWYSLCSRCAGAHNDAVEGWLVLWVNSGTEHTLRQRSHLRLTLELINSHPVTLWLSFSHPSNGPDTAG